MTALDDAILAQLTHPAGSQADPLTESLCDQATQSGLQPVPLRAGWENEPVDVPLPLWLWALGLLALLLAAFAGPQLPGGPGALSGAQPAPAQASASHAASGVR